MGSVTRECNKCRKFKPHSEFYTDAKDKPFHLTKSCKECIKSKVRESHVQERLECIDILGGECETCGERSSDALYFVPQIPALRLASGKSVNAKFKLIKANAPSAKLYYLLSCANCFAKAKKAKKGTTP